MHTPKSFLFALLLLASILMLDQAKVLSQIDFLNGATNTNTYVFSNPAGLSFSLDELLPELDNQLLQRYLLNSNLYGEWGLNFQISIHNPGGYKYNCSFIQSLNPNSTISCTYDISNKSFITSLGNFNWNVTIHNAMGIGWDNQAANYSDQNYMDNTFVPFVTKLYVASKLQPALFEMADKADTWNSTGFKPNYTYTDPAKDCDALNQYLYIFYTSPGVTQTASSQWYDQIQSISMLCGAFTMRGTVFTNASLLTVANLMSDNYTYQYIRNRLKVNGTDYSSKLKRNLVFFNQLRLIDDPTAANTAANTFAAGLWAIDFLMEWTIIGGKRVDFYSPISNASRQSVLGQAPTYSPSAIYSGLLFALMANLNGPYIYRPAMLAGTSSNIKAYGLQYFSNFGVLILNKDTNSSASGEVVVKIEDTSGMNCFYYSADSLNSISSGTIGGLSFVGNNSQGLGKFTNTLVTADANGLYSVPLNYSQAVFCQTVPQPAYLYFPSGRNLSGDWLKVLFLTVLLLLI